ncbi:MAG: hypothetical protein CL672_01460 [Balneola sp.]|nr:hypothetical protein [Balneola sp.]
MLKVKKAQFHGIKLPELSIGLDYSDADVQYIFVSHAHADHIPRNRQSLREHTNLVIYTTPPTAALMRLRGFKEDIIELPFYETLTTDQFNITLYPAGHILGSAMAFIESGVGNILYTGDCKTPASPATEGFELPKNRPVDQLIIEATFGLPIYRWKSTEQLQSDLLNFAEESLDAGYTPIFLGYNLGKAQEMMHMLRELPKTKQIHGAGYPLCAVYEEYGINLGTYKRYNRASSEGCLLFTPYSGLESGFASHIKKKRIAYCSGWASHEARRTQTQAHALIPLSDHLDYFELIKVCEYLQPKRIYITHTPDPKVVLHELQQRGLEAVYLDIDHEELG